MRRKHVLIFLALSGILTLVGSTAVGHELTVASATTNCTSVCLTLMADQLTPGDMDKITYTFTLTSTTGGSPVTLMGEIDFTVDDTGTFTANNMCFNWLTSGNSLSDNFTVSGSATLSTPEGDTSTLPFDLGGNNSLNCGPTPPGKTFSIGPSSMEGNLTIHPGDWINGGYNFKFTSNTHGATMYSVTATVTVPVTCAGGSIENIVVPLGAPGQLDGGGVTSFTYNIAAGDTSNHATNDQNSILAWEGAVQAPPNLCGGAGGNNSKGAIFSATVNQNPHVGLVDWQFHYRDPAAKGKPNTDCTNANDPNRNRADVCGASWSQTVRDP